MPPINGNDASPASEIDETQAGGPADTAADAGNSDANPAQSSSAEETDAKQEASSLLDVVKRVVEKPDAQEDPSTSEAKSEDNSNADPEKGDGPEAADAEEKSDDDVPFHKHPRWQEMKSERDAFKADADNYRQITGFMEQTGLTGQEVAQGFEIMALLKSGDPENLSKAREWFAERLTGLDEVLGNVLPDDLREKVRDGYVDEDVAKELARQRARANYLENRTVLQQQQEEQARQAQEVQQAQISMAKAVQSWEEGIKSKDADYASKKAKLVETQVRALIQQRGASPRTPDEALELVQAAYGEVNEILKPLVAKPKPMAPSPTGLSARATTAPNSLRGAIEAALQR